MIDDGAIFLFFKNNRQQKKTSVGNFTKKKAKHF